ncbi:MAG: hypothetical protein NNA18_05455 [Nitrospira sp.]|nr:hypothetical protein [Nitrospira sp.]
MSVRAHYEGQCGLGYCPEKTGVFCGGHRNTALSACALAFVSAAGSREALAGGDGDPLGRHRQRSARLLLRADLPSTVGAQGLSSEDPTFPLELAA